ncbi:hypothetical protein [Sporomusa acidovorans]|nr:hypothetical protein [Sporomusa acidovorans]
MTTPNLDLEIYVEEPDLRAGFDTVRDIAAITGIVHVLYLLLSLD